MGLVIPDSGLLFWMLITFSIVLWLLTKYAWKPIMKSLRDREQTIQASLDAAKEARQQIENLKEENKKLIAEAQKQREQLIKEAKEARDRMIREAQEQAKSKADKIIADAQNQIEAEKKKAIEELKNSVAELTIQISEKILRRELSDKQKQEEYINSIIKDIKFN